MKQSFYLPVLFVFFSLGNACNLETSPEPVEVVSAIDEKIEKVEAAPAQQDALTAQQLKDIETIHATFTEVYAISLNETTKNFRNNQDSGREIEIWMKMVETYEALTKDGQFPKLEQRQEVFSVILASTMMPLGTIKDKVEFKELPESKVDEIYSQFMSKFSPK